MLISNSTQIPENILKNELLYSNQSKIEHLSKIFDLSQSRGNLCSLKINIPPVIFIDLAPGFNIPNGKQEYKNAILNSIIQESKILPYLTYIYKHPITKKSRIDEEEYCYDAIHSAANEIHYVIENIYHNSKDIIIVQLGKYVEYIQLFTMLNYLLQGSSVKLNLVYNHHPSFFIKEKIENFKTNKVFKDDVNRIVKAVKGTSIIS